MSLFSCSLKRLLCAAFVFAYAFTLLGGRADAQHVLPVLGTAPLLGRMSSTAELQKRVVERREMFDIAAQDLGLTEAETSQLVTQIMSGRVRWVEIPRHLDAMTWGWDGSVYMYRDVVIPPDEYGWETDIRVGSNIHELFIPAACGNLSLVERSAPQVSYVPPPPPPPTCPYGMVGNPPNCSVPACPPGYVGTPPNCEAPQPQVAPPPQLTTVVVRTQVREAFAWWLLPLTFLGFFFAGHYHYGPPPLPPPPVKCPPPP